MSTEDFYAALPELTDFSACADGRFYTRAPDDWAVVLTDVAGSTKAIEAGQYKVVNALGVASIVVLLNTVEDVEIPYLFGGDGMTALCPMSKVGAVEKALAALCRTSKDSFGMELRAGILPMADLNARGLAFEVCRYRLSPEASLAFFRGDGAAEAERWLKDSTSVLIEPAEDPIEVKGFECRWRPLESTRGLVSSVIIMPTVGEAGDGSAVISELLDELEQDLGGIAPHRPISEEVMQLNLQQSGFDVEVGLRRSGRSALARFHYRVHIFMENLIGGLAIRFGFTVAGLDGKRYRSQAAANSDFRKFDGALRMVLDLTPEESDSLRRRLQSYREAGRICFGIHTSGSGLMTCIVFSRAAGHLHFIDGADGGYALAAKELKAQLAAL